MIESDFSRKKGGKDEAPYQMIDRQIRRNTIHVPLQNFHEVLNQPYKRPTGEKKIFNSFF